MEGRSCPLHYRYAPTALAGEPAFDAEVVYVVGGLYGNPFALDALPALLAAEQRAGREVRLVFNGDFNWFDIDVGDFRRVNETVLRHTAILGNVELELADASDAGCGCAYPDFVEQAVVDRSNRIIARLRQTAQAFPDIRAALLALPKTLCIQVGGKPVGIVHGDSHSLAGWDYAVEHLSANDSGWRTRLAEDFYQAEVRVIASSHTCLPVLRQVPVGGKPCALINNGAAGMPNFAGDSGGLISRIAVTPAPPGVNVRYGVTLDDLYCQAVDLPFDAPAWLRHFDRVWPEGSDASLSYRRRIARGPDFRLGEAFT